MTYSYLEHGTIITFKEDLSWPQELCDKQEKFKYNDLPYYLPLSVKP